MSWSTINEKGIQSGWKTSIPSVFIKTKKKRCGCGRWIEEIEEECFKCKTGSTISRGQKRE